MMRRSIHRWKLLLPVLFVCALAMAVPVRAASDDGVLTKVKHWFTGTPTPAPTPKKKKSTTKRHSSTAAPHASASPTAKRSSSPRPTKESERAPTPTPTEAPEPSASASPEESPEETPEPSETASPTPEERTVESTKTKAHHHAAASASPSATEPVPAASASRTAPASIAASEIVGYEKNPPAVRKILDTALGLTGRNLGYKYGSADPAQGGMDCSGFIYYVLKQTGMGDVPRDAREQYIWVRKAGKFQAVLGKSPDTFELDALKPGDLLFWAGTYHVDRDPAITHTMIYLGRDKATNQRIMVGSSDGRTYKGQSKYGVSVFDFKMAGRKASSSGEPGPVFVGYASIPGLGEG
jgi:peptidoglycan DL-endopeptidase CwlO